MVMMLCLTSALVSLPAAVSAQDNARNISLAEASALALKNNFEIQLTKYDILMSRQGVDAARSVYDTMLTARVSYQDDRLSRNSTLLADRVTNQAYTAGLWKSFPSGTTLSVEQSFDREWTSGSSAVYNPGHEAVTRLSVEQDLGRNFFGTADRGRVKIAMKDVENAQYLSFYKMEQQIASVQKAYWNLVLLNEIDRVSQEMLEQAKRLFEIDQDRFQRGLAERPQLLGSEANYKARLADAALSASALSAGMNLLKLELNLDDAGVVLVPEDVFTVPEHRVDLLGSMERALSSRPDYQQALNEAARQDIRLEVARHNAWPEIQLKASFARNGLGHDANDAFSRTGSEHDQDFSASAALSMPLENRLAKSQLKETAYQKARALVNAKYTERRIAVEIADQVTACGAAYERLQLLKQAADLQTRRAAEQEKIFRQGRSDSDTVIRYQNDALAARMQSAQAFYDYHASLIELKRREGTLLKDVWDGEI